MELVKRDCTIYYGMTSGEEYLANCDYSSYDMYGGFYGDCTLLRVMHDVPCIIIVNNGLYDSSNDVYVQVEHEYEELYLSLTEVLKKGLIDKIIE